MRPPRSTTAPMPGTLGPITPGKGDRHLRRRQVPPLPRRTPPRRSRSSLLARAGHATGFEPARPSHQVPDNFQTTPPRGQWGHRFRLEVNYVEVPVTGEGLQGQAGRRPHLARLQGVREQHTPAFARVQRRSRAAFDRIRHRSDPALQRDGEGEPFSRAPSRARSPLTTRPRSSPTPTAPRSGPASPARRATAARRAVAGPGRRHRPHGAGQRRPVCRLRDGQERQLRRSQRAAGRLHGQPGLHQDPQGDSHPQRRHPSAAKELSTRPKERRRIIYVVSDGKEYGSKASWKEVVRYLQTNKIAVYGTLVGDSARWGEGWLDRFHLPFPMYDNILYKYTAGDRRRHWIPRAAPTASRRATPRSPPRPATSTRWAT